MDLFDIAILGMMCSAVVMAYGAFLLGRQYEAKRHSKKVCQSRLTAMAEQAHDQIVSRPATAPYFDLAGKQLLRNPPVKVKQKPKTPAPKSAVRAVKKKK